MSTPARKVTVQLIGAYYDAQPDVLTCVLSDGADKEKRISIKYRWGELANGANEPELTIKLGWTAIPDVNGFMLAAILLGRMHIETSPEDDIPFIDAAIRLANQEILIDLLV